MNDSYTDQLTCYLSGFVSNERKALMERILQNRTRYLTVVLEDVFKPHNANAVIRSCEGFGIQDVHVIENKYKFDYHALVAQGASKWVDIYRYRKMDRKNSERCYSRLKAEGYKILATVPQKDALSLNDLEIDQKLAVVFGSELDGLSSYARENADAYLTIPMWGFSQSFNLSVSVAICLYDLTEKLRVKPEEIWKLNEEEQRRVRLEWMKRSVRAAELLEKRFLNDSKRSEK